MKIDDISKNFKDIAEYKAYSEAQYKLIINQSKKINELENKIKDLEKLLASSTPIIGEENELPKKLSIQLMSSEEAIAVMEIEKLKDLSLERDLSMEETKRYEIFTKTLLNIRNSSINNQQKNDGLENISADDLLKALAQPETNE
jgi:hypothetical protein